MFFCFSFHSKLVKVLNCSIRSLIASEVTSNNAFTPNCSTVKEAKTEPYIIPIFRVSKSILSALERIPEIPPAKLSPAPVGSITCSTGNAGAMNIFVRINDTLITGPTSDRILDGITRKSVLDIAKDEGIKVEVRKFTVTEIVEASKNGSLKEMFGAGTAAVISPIATFGFKDTDYHLPELENPVGLQLKKRITDIQTNKAEDLFGWTVGVE
mgnify:CR=1 FL=1